MSIAIARVGILIITREMTWLMLIVIIILDKMMRGSGFGEDSPPLSMKGGTTLTHFEVL